MTGEFAMPTTTEPKIDPRNWLEAREHYGLTYRQWRFCTAYAGEAECRMHKAAALSYGKADGLLTEGGSMDYYVARSIATQNLKIPKIQQCIQDLMGTVVMKPNEVMHRLSKLASANMAELLQVNEDGTAKLDMAKAVARGAMYVVKKMNFDSFGNLKSIEVHDAFAALTKLGQHYKLFDRTREQQIDPKDLARELLDDLRAKHEDIPDHMLIAKVLDRFSGSGVTESDLVEVDNTNGPAS